MRKLLNTLYVTTPEAYLSKDGLNVVISVQQEEVFRIPVINIEGIVTFGYMGASPGVMKLCIVVGTFFLCAAPTDKDNFASLTEEQVQTCLKRFAIPEQFIQVGDGVFVLPAP